MVHTHSETELEKAKKNRVPIVGVFLLGAFLAVLNQTLLITATPHIMDELGLTENTAQWVTTIFMLVSGIMIPITAFLMETFTTRRLFTVSMMIFILGTFISALSLNFPMLMVGRIVQSIGAGVIMPLMMTVFMIIFPIERRGFAMGIAGLVISFAPALGPALSGWFIEYLPWRWLFYAILPIAIIDLILAFYYMKDVIPRSFPKVDVLSIILSTLGFGGLLYGFSSAGDYGWSSNIVIVAIFVGVIALTWFILRQLNLKQPMLEFRVFKYRTFTFATIIGMITFTVLIAAETLLPIYMQLMAGFSALESGLMILPGALLMGFASPIIGRIFDRVGARWLLIIGMFIMATTTLLFTNLTENTSLFYLTVAFAVRMIGIAMVMMPSTTAGLNILPIHLISHGTAMINTMRQVSASIGTAMFITIMTVTALEPSSANDLSALIHGVNISFYVMTGVTFVGLILTLFINEKRLTTPE